MLREWQKFGGILTSLFRLSRRFAAQRRPQLRPSSTPKTEISGTNGIGGPFFPTTTAPLPYQPRMTPIFTVFLVFGINVGNS
jgi:hypothetical protein